MHKVLIKIKQIHWHVAFSVVFFFGGFVWDALTIGRNVASSDIWIFAGYLLLAFLLVYLISHPKFVLLDHHSLSKPLKMAMEKGLPFLALQFLYGSLLSALFILYFKSTGYWLAWLITICLGGLLVLNEFMESGYRRHTTVWAMLGLCAMLFLNFALPFILGSVHAIWFYLSTLTGAAIVTWIYQKTPSHLGSIKPVWMIASILMFAYWADAIPPVPLVAQETALGYEIQKIDGDYQLSKQAAPWVQFWHRSIDTLYRQDKVVCFSSIFAPIGLNTTLYHDWQHYDAKQGWQTLSRVGFKLTGGRHEGYRGYTYKTNLALGDWRVLVTTEAHKTIAVHRFNISNTSEPKRIEVHY
jgi:hypothetical protein